MCITICVQTTYHGCSECTNSSAVSAVCQTAVSRQSRPAAVTRQTAAGTALRTVHPPGPAPTAGTDHGGGSYVCLENLIPDCFVIEAQSNGEFAQKHLLKDEAVNCIRSDSRYISN